MAPRLSLKLFSLFLAANSLFELFNKLSLNSFLFVSLLVYRLVIKAAGNSLIYRVGRPKIFPKMHILQIWKAGAWALTNMERRHHRATG